jgi:hypothetical protein
MRGRCGLYTGRHWPERHASRQVRRARRGTYTANKEIGGTGKAIRTGSAAGMTPVGERELFDVIKLVAYKKASTRPVESGYICGSSGAFNGPYTAKYNGASSRRDGVCFSSSLCDQPYLVLLTSHLEWGSDMNQKTIEIVAKTPT